MDHITDKELREGVARMSERINNRRTLEILYEFATKLAMKEKKESVESPNIALEIDSRPLEGKEDMKVSTYIKDVIRKVNEEQKA